MSNLVAKIINALEAQIRTDPNRRHNQRNTVSYYECARNFANIRHNLRFHTLIEIMVVIGPFLVYWSPLWRPISWAR